MGSFYGGHEAIYRRTIPQSPDSAIGPASSDPINLTMCEGDEGGDKGDSSMHIDDNEDKEGHSTPSRRASALDPFHIRQRRASSYSRRSSMSSSSRTIKQEPCPTSRHQRASSGQSSRSQGLTTSQPTSTTFSPVRPDRPSWRGPGPRTVTKPTL